MELFRHFGFMVAGGILISSPIIIHLINRMRYRRIRWAAMEFLLKSQTRNRRRLIIEQLLLLALRCLLVLLVGFLVARYIGNTFGIFNPENSTLHLVVLDDTLSMKDRWKDETEAKTAFDSAVRRIHDIAKSAAQANSAQHLKLVCLSDLNQVLFDERVNEDTVGKLDDILKSLHCSNLHVAPIEAVKWARNQHGHGGQQRAFHLVSDFRDSDWSGAAGESLQQEIEVLTQANVKILLFDVAHPFRAQRQAVVLNHDNIGITDLRPETRIAAEGMPVQFTLLIRNNGVSELKGVFLNVKVNDEVRFEASQPIPNIPVGVSTHSFVLNFNQSGFNRISASLYDDGAGIKEDNMRLAVVEIRKQVPVLIVDGNGSDGLKPGGDTFYLSTVLTATKGYQPVSRSVRELETVDLDQYPCIYLLNVPQFTPKSLIKLQHYAEQGGRIAIFLGDKVRSTYYNETLYKNGEGLFPIPLAVKPTEPLSEEDKTKRRFEEQMQIYLRDEAHPILAPLVKSQNLFQYLVIGQFFPSLPRFQWKTSESARLEELVTLPNRKPVDAYRSQAQDLNKQLPISDDRYIAYRAGLEFHHRKVLEALQGEYLYHLANAFDALLNDGGDPSDPEKRPNLKEFWKLPEMQKLRKEINAFRETVQYGDPLLVVHRYGRGRVVACMTSAGKSWNDWPNDSLASCTYPVLVLELQKYLTGVSDEGNRPVGAPMEVRVDPSRYEAKAQCFYQGISPDDPEKENLQKKGGAGLQPRGELLGKTSDSDLVFTFNQTQEPGAYFIRLQPRILPGVEEPKPEERAYVFNVNTEAEGDLKRANQDTLDQKQSTLEPERAKIILVTPDMTLDILRQRQPDMSESPWLYLVLLMILVAEQALAVHLSFHIRGNEAPLASQTLRAGGAAPEAGAA